MLCSSLMSCCLLFGWHSCGVATCQMLQHQASVALFAGQVPQTLQNGGQLHNQLDGYAHNGDSASAASQGATDAEYADSATDPPGMHTAAQQMHMQGLHSSYVSTEQDSYEEEREDTTSEGTQ